MAHDITPQPAIASTPDRAERARTRQTRVLERIATGAALGEVLEEIVDLVEEQLPDSRCSIFLLDRPGGALSFAAGRRLAGVFTGMPPIAIGPAAGPCGSAAFRREAVIVTDALTDPLCADYRDIAQVHALRSCWSVPILASGAPADAAVLGTFALYRREAGPPPPMWATAMAAAAHLAGVALDRENALQALRESEARYRILVESATDAVLLHDDQGIIQDVNQRACESLGLTREELIGRSPFAFDADVTPEQMRDVFDRLRRSETVTLESRHRRKDGTLFPVEIRINSFAVGDRRFGVAVARDITERKRAEATLRRSEATLRRAQAIANLASWTYDVASGTFQGAADVARLLGLPDNLADPVDAITRAVHPDDAPRIRAAWQMALEGGPCEIEHRVIVDGETRWLYVRTEAEEEVEGRPARLTGVTQDITARRRLEEQVQQSQKMEAIGLLAGGIAHDFNNLLTVIAGHTDLLATAMPEDDPLSVDVSAIREAGKRAARLTGQLLAFSRKAIVEPRVLDLNHVVGSMGDMLGRLLGETVELCTYLDPELGHVRADPGQIEQLLMNLAVNGRDAMPNGGRLTIRTCSVDIAERDAGKYPEHEPGRYACLCVADTGSGMSDEVKARIFEPFFTTKGLGKGTGLGLATVFGIVKQAGGSIAVETAVGKGTLMKVLLPALPPEPARTVPISLERAVRPGHETILVAEDEEGVRRLATIALEAQGYTVIAVSSGSEALVASAEHDGPIDVLLTDVVMPDLGGRELAVRMRAMRPAIRVLYMSGYTDDAAVRGGVGNAADAFLPKPFTPRVLAAKVSAVLNGLTEP